MPDEAKASKPRPMAARFSRRKAQGAITAIEIDGHVLLVVQTSRSGDGPTITRTAKERLELTEQQLSDAAAVGGAVAAALQRLKIKPGAVVIGVPRPVVVLRTLSFPPISDVRELASMVQFQMGKDLPFRAEDAIIDFTFHRQTSSGSDTSETDAEQKLEVLAVAVKREVVEFYARVAQAAGLKLAGLGWLSYSNARVVEACGIAQSDQPVALISLRPDEVNVDVIVDGALLFSRGATIHIPTEPAPEATSVDRPAADEGVDLAVASSTAPAPRPQTYAEAAAIESVRSLHSYSSLVPNRPVSRLVVAGATGDEERVVDALQQRISLPINVLDPMRALKLPADAREHAAGALSAIGLALAANDPEGLPFDFLNPKRPPPQRNVRRLRVLAAAAAITTVLVSTTAVRQFMLNQRRKVYRDLQVQLAQEEKKRPIYRQMRVQADTVQEWLSEGRNWLEHYAYLTAILPPSEDVYLTSLSMSGKGTVRLSVQARSGDVLARLDKQLRAAGYDVKPLAISPGTDRYGYDFRSTVELSVPEKMKVDLANARPPARPADDASLGKPTAAITR
jgi:type IV pilus assembly protein PilM